MVLKLLEFALLRCQTCVRMPALCISLAFALLAPFGFAFAQEAARLHLADGVVEVRRAGSSEWTSAPVGTVLNVGDSLRTGPSCRAALRGVGGIMVRLGAGTVVDFKQPLGAKRSEMNINEGKAHFLSRDTKDVPNVTTSVVSGAIRGTEFVVETSKNESRFAVLDGQVEMHNDKGSLLIEAGEQGEVQTGTAPHKRLIAHQLESVQWALYYPVVTVGSDFEDGALSKVSDAISLGNARRALTDLAAHAGPEARLLEISARLSLGDIEAAQSLALNISRSNIPPRAGAILAAQRAIIALVTGLLPDAREFAEQAVRTDSSSASAALAQSFVFQGAADLESARASAERAYAVSPHDTSVILRLAEILLSFGEVDQAQHHLQSITERAPHHAYAHALLGFAALQRGDSGKAEEHFEIAATTPAIGGLPHLGLGLVQIRKGQLEPGKDSIQTAVLLDPSVALYRSYLGKAFFELDRYAPSLAEYNRAIALDDRDPTPYFYRAQLQLANHRPVRALGDIEQSISRNDNRAVYRSKFLLDQDHAARSVSLAQTFSALDFLQAARNEASKSLVKDPSNYSAHFFLADSYITSRYERAVLNERLIGTLLAPISYNALLPSAGGSASLNEYTTLFDRNTNRTRFDLFARDRDKRIESAIVNLGVIDNFAYMVRYFDLYSDGHRQDDHDRRHAVRTLLQYQVTPQDKLLVDGIFISADSGDIATQVDPHANDPDLDFSLQDYSFRLGAHHEFNLQSHLIAQVNYADSRFIQDDESLDRTYFLDLISQGEFLEGFEDVAHLMNRAAQDRSGTRGDIQHIFDTAAFSLVSGYGHSQFDLEQEQRGIGSAELLDPIELLSNADVDERAQSGYLYSTLHLFDGIDALLGGTYADVQIAKRGSDPFIDEIEQHSSWLPKAGLAIEPLKQLTLRSAYFETLGSAGARDFDSLEPTHILGINQIYSDAPGTRARNASVRADWKAPRLVYAGAELAERRTISDFTNVTQLLELDIDTLETLYGAESEDFDEHASEHSAETYIYGVFTDSFVGTIDYDWSELDNDFFEFQARTHRLRLGFTYYDPSGWYGFGSGTWRTQDRDGVTLVGESESSDFWIFSAGIGMQLPHRHGSIELVVRNIFDQSYRYLPTSRDADFFPGVDVALGINLSF